MFEFPTNAVMTIAVAAASAVACSLLGCFLLLKRMSLLADAIAHGVLPGIALAVLLSGQTTGMPILLGATVFGLITALLAQWLSERANVSADASMGVVFTALFALGIILISTLLGNVHIDQHCIAFSSLELTPLFRTTILGVTFPTALGPLLLMLALVLLVIGAFWKELKLTTFDPGLAKTLGQPVGFLHYVLVALTAGSTVASFESFGSILVLGMFVVPPATARLLTDRLASMLMVSAAAAVSACVIGYWLASPEVLGCSASGMIVVAAGGQFLVALLAAPRHGVFAHALRRFRLTQRMAEEELLASLFRLEETPGRVIGSRDHAFSPIVVAFARWNLARKKLIRGAALSEQGRKTAQSIVRAHRLWEAYLEKNFGLPLDHLHASATEIEHYLGPELQARLADELAAPPRDPHGRSIPAD